MSLVLVSLVIAAATVPVSAAPGLSTPPAPTGDHGRADADGDGISDGLAASLVEMAPDDEVEVIVMADSPAARSQAEGRLGPFRIVEQLPIIDGFVATASAAQVRGLARMPGVRRVQPNGRATVANDSAQRDHGAVLARAQYGTDGSGAGVCVADTGVDPLHEQLDGPKLVGWFDVIGGQPDPYDDHGHGTHVAATAVGDGSGGPQAATYGGVAPGADLYAVKVLDASGVGSDAQVVAGIDWCASQPEVDIISMSLGTSSGSDGLDAMSVAANNAVTLFGKTVVVAAGNAGDADDTVGAPGAAAEAITVGASAEWSGASGSPQRSDGPYLAPFSSRGPTLDGRIKPDVVAPGVTITSADAGTTSGYTTLSGTSMATPFVAGLAALALEVDPASTPAQLKSSVMGSARDLGAPGLDNQWGAGIVDGLAVVAAAAGDARATPIPDSVALSGVVPDNGEWTHSFDVTPSQVGHPVALTLLIDGDFDCALFLLGICFLSNMETDLDVELRNPSGVVVQDSGCPLFNDCGSGGRQETIHYMPSVAGTYELRVFPFPDPGTGQAPGGSFQADLFVGPPPTPVVVPGGGWTAEGDLGTTSLAVPVTLSAPSALPVTVGWETFFWNAEGMAVPGEDYLASSGTVEFEPGQTEASVAITLIGDTDPEPGLVYGEWIWVRFVNPPTNAALDTSFFGLGAGVILDDD
ncbi:MAG: S8 family serine peptidase [Acidimicrobiia bacterium]|nr:S8 family serine peptidase [Acidimicrobiia bacterium]